MCEGVWSGWSVYGGGGVCVRVCGVGGVCVRVCGMGGVCMEGVEYV